MLNLFFFCRADTEPVMLGSGTALERWLGSGGVQVVAGGGRQNCYEGDKRRGV